MESDHAAAGGHTEPLDPRLAQPAFVDAAKRVQVLPPKRCKDLLHGRVYDVITKLEAVGEMEHENEALEKLMAQATAKGANLVLNVHFEHGDSERKRRSVRDRVEAEHPAFHVRGYVAVIEPVADVVLSPVERRVRAWSQAALRDRLGAMSSLASLIERWREDAGSIYSGIVRMLDLALGGGAEALRSVPRRAGPIPDSGERRPRALPTSRERSPASAKDGAHHGLKRARATRARSPWTSQKGRKPRAEADSSAASPRRCPQ